MANNDEIIASFFGVKKAQYLRALSLWLSSAFTEGKFYNHKTTGLP